MGELLPDRRTENTQYTRLLWSAQRASMVYTATGRCISLLVCVISLQAVQGEDFKKEANPPLNCPTSYRAKVGDKVIISYLGFLKDGTKFDNGTSEFVIGDHKVIKGWEMGMEGGCAGETIAIVAPPEYGYGDTPSDKVPPSSTLYFINTLDAIVRVTKPPQGGDCPEGRKAKPGLHATLGLKGKVVTPNDDGKYFLGSSGSEKESEIGFGQARPIRLVRGLEKTLTGACVDEERLIFLGPSLAYGSTGNKNKKVKPGDSVRLQVRIKRVRNKKPSKELLDSFFKDVTTGNLRLKN